MLVGNQSLPPREMTYDSPTFKKNWIYHNVYKNRSTKNIQSILISPNCHAIFTFTFYIDISHYTSLYATNVEKKWRNPCQKLRILYKDTTITFQKVSQIHESFYVKEETPLALGVGLKSAKRRKNTDAYPASFINVSKQVLKKIW